MIQKELIQKGDETERKIFKGIKRMKGQTERKKKDNYLTDRQKR